jgi:hypothetical protein
MVLILFHDQRSRSTSGLRASEVSTFLACLLPEMLLPRVHDLSTCVLPQINDYESLRLFGLQKFQTSLLHFLLECFHPKSTILRRVSSGIDGRYILLAFRPSGVFDPTQPVTYFPFQSAQSSGLHDLSPRGEMMEVDMWPNQAGDMCHVLINFSIFQKLKSY